MAIGHFAARPGTSSCRGSLDRAMWQGRGRRSGKPDETESSNSRGVETISHTPYKEPKKAQAR